MPPFPERESSLLAKLKKKKALAAGIQEEEVVEPVKPVVNGQGSLEAAPVNAPEPVAPNLIGIGGSNQGAPAVVPENSAAGLLVDVFETSSTTVHSSAPTTLSPGAEENLTK